LRDSFIRDVRARAEREASAGCSVLVTVPVSDERVVDLLAMAVEAAPGGV
jgi:hypothetical protein